MIAIDRPLKPQQSIVRGEYLVDLVCEELGTRQTRKLSVLGIYDGQVNATDEFGSLLQLGLGIWQQMNPRRFYDVVVPGELEELPVQCY